MKNAMTMILLALFASIPLLAKPKEKNFKQPAAEVFKAALAVAREHHVVTYVDEKQEMFTFETGASMTSFGFVCNASVEPEKKGAKLVLNVQKKKAGALGISFQWGAGDRLAKKFFGEVADELAKPEQDKKKSSP